MCAFQSNIWRSERIICEISWYQRNPKTLITTSSSSPPLCDIFFWGPHDITRYFGNWYDNHTIFTIFYKRKYVQNLHFFLLKARSGDSWQLAKKRVDYNFFGNLYFPVSDHLWGVYFDFLCHFHLKIASPIGTFIHQ